MHMADALISPQVGGIFWTAGGTAIFLAARKVKEKTDDFRAPLMGVMGAFIFAAQMINFTIPGTGSSGHLAGGLLLAALLGPAAGFLVMASVLVIQALFFADGGLLALGCNIWNMGFYACFIAYPLIFRPLAGKDPRPIRLALATMTAGIVALQLGAVSVVGQTFFSGRSDLPLGPFLMFMQPIHLAIGLVEGSATFLVLRFVQKARPDLIPDLVRTSARAPFAAKKLAACILGTAIITGGFVSWFASSHPDGLEWSIEKVAGKTETAVKKNTISARLKRLQDKTAMLPDYTFSEKDTAANTPPHEQLGVSLSGILGSGLVLAAITGIVAVIRRLRRSVSIAADRGIET